MHATGLPVRPHACGLQGCGCGVAAGGTGHSSRDGAAGVRVAWGRFHAYEACDETWTE